jgi:hypothetical protein
MTKGYNDDLTPLPDDDTVIAAVREIVAGRSPSFLLFRDEPGATENEVALRLGVQGAARLGSGAKAYSWSGTMSAATRMAPRLRKLAREGRLIQRYDRRNYRNAYLAPEAP